MRNAYVILPLALILVSGVPALYAENTLPAPAETSTAPSVVAPEATPALTKSEPIDRVKVALESCRRDWVLGYLQSNYHAGYPKGLLQYEPLVQRILESLDKAFPEATERSSLTQDAFSCSPSTQALYQFAFIQADANGKTPELSSPNIRKLLDSYQQQFHQAINEGIALSTVSTNPLMANLTSQQEKSFKEKLFQVVLTAYSNDTFDDTYFNPNTYKNYIDEKLHYQDELAKIIELAKKQSEQERCLKIAAIRQMIRGLFDTHPEFSAVRNDPSIYAELQDQFLRDSSLHLQQIKEEANSPFRKDGYLELAFTRKCAEKLYGDANALNTQGFSALELCDQATTGYCGLKNQQMARSIADLKGQFSLIDDPHFMKLLETAYQKNVSQNLRSFSSWQNPANFKLIQDHLYTVFLSYYQSLYMYNVQKASKDYVHQKLVANFKGNEQKAAKIEIQHQSYYNSLRNEISGYLDLVIIKRLLSNLQPETLSSLPPEQQDQLKHVQDSLNAIEQDDTFKLKASYIEKIPMTAESFQHLAEENHLYELFAGQSMFSRWVHRNDPNIANALSSIASLNLTPLGLLAGYFIPAAKIAKAATDTQSPVDSNYLMPVMEPKQTDLVVTIKPLNEEPVIPDAQCSLQ